MALLACVPSAATAQSGGANAPAPGTLFLYPERIPLRDGSLTTAERGTLFVPLNRADTTSGVISIDLWRFPAETPSDAPPIVLLHGGPGWPGLDGSLENPDYWENVIARFTAVTDLIVIGQRGIGSSKPNTLGENRPPQRCRAYWDSAGIDLAGFTVIEAAADVRDAHDFGVRVNGSVEVDFPAVMERMRKLRAGISTNDSAARFRDLGVDVALECTGIFTKRDAAAQHLDAGARKVLISAPARTPTSPWSSASTTTS